MIHNKNLAGLDIDLLTNIYVERNDKIFKISRRIGMRFTFIDSSSDFYKKKNIEIKHH